MKQSGTRDPHLASFLIGPSDVQLTMIPCSCLSPYGWSHNSWSLHIMPLFPIKWRCFNTSFLWFFFHIFIWRWATLTRTYSLCSMGRAVSHEQPQLQRADDAQLFCRVLVATAQNEALCVCVCVCIQECWHAHQGVKSQLTILLLHSSI